MRKKLGELLLERGIIDREQLTSALAYQRQWGQRLGTALVTKGFVTEGVLTQVLSQTLGTPMVDLSQARPDKEALKLMPVALAEQHGMVPLQVESTRGRPTLLVAMEDPLNLSAIEQVEFITGCKIKPVIATGTNVEQAIRAWLRHEPVLIDPVKFEKTEELVRPGDEEPMQLVRAGGSESVAIHSGSSHAVVAQPAQPAPMVGTPVAGTPRPPPVQGVPMQARAGSPMAPVPVSMPGVPPPMPVMQGAVLQGTVVQGTMPPHAHPQAVPPAFVNTVPGNPAQPLPSLPPPVLPRDATEELEKKFWALMRVLARKGLISKEEFLREWESMG